METWGKVVKYYPFGFVRSFGSNQWLRRYSLSAGLTPLAVNLWLHTLQEGCELVVVETWACTYTRCESLFKATR